MHSHLHGHPALTHAVRRLEHLSPDQYELYFEKKISTKIDSKNQEIDSLSRAEDVGIAIRVIKDQKLGFSFTTSLDPDAIQKAVDTAIEIANLMPADEFVGFQSFGSSVYPEVDHYDVNGLELPMSRKIALAKELESVCRKQDPRITGVRSATVGETIYEVHMVDSHGEHLQHKSTLYSGSVTCKAEQGGDSQMGGEYGFSNYLDTLEIQTIGKSAARYATELLGAKPAPTMRCPAILRNTVVADLIEFLSSSFSAEEIDKGRSMLAGKKGQITFSEKLTLIDDGLLPGGLGTQPFDGEGVPCRKNILVDGGFISGALYDGYYAKKTSQDPTGNSTRSIKSPPSISFSNLFLQKGKKTFEQLVSQLSKGILVTDLMGIHTANPVTGDFSLGASGILIENGKLTHPVRGFAVAGNILDVFRRVTDVGKDLKFVGSVGAPSLLISEISVGGV